MKYKVKAIRFTTKRAIKRVINYFDDETFYTKSDFLKKGHLPFYFNYNDQRAIEKVVKLLKELTV